MKNKELTIEEKYEKLQNYLKNNKTNEKFLSLIYKIILLIMPISLLIMFIAIFFTNNPKFMITIFLISLASTFIIIAFISMKITKTDLEIAKYEITELDGLFAFIPMLFKENSNHYYIVFKLTNTAQIYHCYRLDCEQIERFKKVKTINNAFIYLDKSFLTHKTDIKMTYFTLEQINIQEYTNSQLDNNLSANKEENNEN